MQETQVQSLGQEDPLEEEMATHSSVLAWEIRHSSLAGYSPWGRKELEMTKQLTLRSKEGRRFETQALNVSSGTFPS